MAPGGAFQEPVGRSRGFQIVPIALARVPDGSKCPAGVPSRAGGSVPEARGRSICAGARSRGFQVVSGSRKLVVARVMLFDPQYVDTMCRSM